MNVKVVVYVVHVPVVVLVGERVVVDVTVVVCDRVVVVRVSNVSDLL